MRCSPLAVFNRTFAREQYFDSNGLFITVVLSTPILLNCIVLLVSLVDGCCRAQHLNLALPISLFSTNLQSIWLMQASSMLVKVKRAELKHKQAANKTTSSTEAADNKAKPKENKKQQ